jgi:hypothetical protein
VPRVSRGRGILPTGRATSPHISNSEGIWPWVGLLLFSLGILASLHYIYDLRYPSHFVGDMYGLEVIARVSWLCSAAGPMFFGGVLLFLDWRKKTRRWRILGMALVIVPSTILVAMAVDVVQSRRLDEIRKGYPEKSVAELLAIAREQKDQHAIYPLIAKPDAAALPGLAQILLDENEQGSLRYSAAEALGRIGNEDAQKALVIARDSSTDKYFKEHIGRIIDNMRSKQ